MKFLNHLELGPKFITVQPCISYMDTISKTESTALKLTYEKKDDTDAMKLRETYWENWKQPNHQKTTSRSINNGCYRNWKHQMTSKFTLTTKEQVLSDLNTDRNSTPKDQRANWRHWNIWEGSNTDTDKKGTNHTEKIETRRKGYRTRKNTVPKRTFPWES